MIENIKKISRPEMILGFSLFSMISTRLSLDIGFNLTPVYIVNIIMIYDMFWVRKARINKEFFVIYLPILVFYIYSSFSSIYAVDITSSLRFVLGAIFILLTIFIHCLYYNTFNIRIDFVLLKIAKYYIVISLLYYILGMFYYTGFPEGSRIFGVLIEKGIPRAIGIAGDPNFASLSYGIMLILFLDIKKTAVIFKVIAIFLIIATLSRGALIGVMLIMIIFNIRFNLKSIRMGLIFLFVCVFVFVFFENNLFILDLIDKRMAGLESGGGRFEIWMNALSLFDSSPIFGYGIFNFRYLNELYFNDSHFAHNTYLEVLIEIGVLGFYVFSFMIMSIYLAAYKTFKKNKYALKIVMLTFIMATTLSLYLNPILIFIILITYMTYVERNKNE